MKLLALAVIAALSGSPAFSQETFAGSAALDAQMEQAVKEGLIPGGVLVIGHEGKIVHRKAYGQRALVPLREAMTIDTIFDLASLSKVVGTTPSVMKLFEQGKIRLIDPVTVYLPEFQGGKSDITVRDLLTHFSGLRPDLDLEPAWSGYDTGIRKALIDKPTYPPGQRFVYSDINFELLGEIVRRVSGKPLDEFARDEVFKPLGMSETMYRPPASLRARIAPTEIDASTGQPLRGVVHDPTTRYMGGVAGHAGVFSTASDLARYAELFLGLGERGGVRIFSPLTVQKFTEPASPPDQPALRGLGWDIDTSYSSARGELFPIGSYGHLGYTGTSLWIDPSSKTYVILLTNYVHPKSGKNLSPLRRSIGTIAAASLGITAKVNLNGYNESLESTGARRTISPNHRVQTGLDVLEEQKFAPLQGKRVGLITNQTGLDREGRRNIDAMRAAGVNVTALFSPEHGLSGDKDVPDIQDSKDAVTGIPVSSLYRNSAFRLTPEMLRPVDTLVFDIQDVGARFYTYGCLMLFAMDQAAKSHVPFYVLDRPNPITGVHVEGPMRDAMFENQAVGCYALPIRHGLTMGELATMANGEKKLGLDLHVIKMKSWERGDWLDSTDLTWVDPSPNMRSLSAATLYPGVAMLESSPNFSVGRGTDAPFEQIGADWIKGAELAQALNQRSIPGIRVYPTRFQPADSVFKGKTIEGVRFVILNRETFSSVRFGMELAFAIQRLYPGKLNIEACKLSIANRKVMDSMKAGTDPSTIELHMQEDLDAYVARRKPFLLY